DLLIDLQYSYGNDILNLSRHSGEDRTGQANSYATVLNGWTPQNQNTMIAQNRPSAAYYTTTVDSHMVEDGSFIRGRNLVLGYNFADNVVKRLRINNLRIYASVQNWFLITKYSGYDPEVRTYGDNFAQGITFFDYPKPRTFLFCVVFGLIQPVNHTGLRREGMQRRLLNKGILRRLGFKLVNR
ncbi:MAG: hypothetical protein AAGC58_03185, partial [Asticcacaulis sp.]